MKLSFIYTCAFSARSPALTHPETVGQTLRRNWDAIAILYPPRAAAAALREQLRYAKLGQVQPGLPFLGPKERRQPRIGLLPQPFAARLFEPQLRHVPGDGGASQREYQRRCRRGRNHAHWACPREKPIADVLRLLRRHGEHRHDRIVLVDRDPAALENGRAQPPRIHHHLRVPSCPNTSRLKVLMRCFSMSE